MLKPSRALRIQSTPRRPANPPSTHFTSTGPHAFSPIQGDASRTRASTINVQQTGHKGETPRQRVERLRAAARAAQLAELPWQERLIDRVRYVTDKVHRSFILFLVGSSVIIGGYTVYALGDMFRYNRRKKAEWLKERQKQSHDALYGAIKAVDEGNATVKQRILVKRYEMVKDAEEERIRNRGIISKIVEWIVPGIQARQSQARRAMKLDDDIIHLLQSGEIDKFLEDHERAGVETSTTIASTNLAGGLLDQKAQIAADGMRAAAKEWTGALRWR